MRLGVYYAIFPYYRVTEPMKAMERRGHEVVWLDADGKADQRRLAECDVVHVYRQSDDGTRRAFKELTRGGTPIVYDNDDNMAALSAAEGAAAGAKRSGLVGHRIHVSTVRMAQIARIFTTPSEVLAEQYRRAGVRRVEVIDNYLAPDVLRPRIKHDGIVIGWVAGAAHQVDVGRLKLAETLQRLVAKHDHVRVECIGVDLALPERYRHDPVVPFEELPRRIGGFDIGIAPLADVAVNRARSNIKVKEYAASGVPWLASPVGPYIELGEAQGGRLVPDDGWFDALERLVTHGRERRRLGRKAKQWANSQTIDVVADRWEQVFLEAASNTGQSTRA